MSQLVSPEDIAGIKLDPPPSQPVDPGDVAGITVDPHVPTTTGDAAKAGGTGFLTGMAQSVASPSDMAKALSHGVGGENSGLMDALTRLLMPVARSSPVTSDTIADMLKKIGISYEPRGDAAKVIGHVANTGGRVVGGGLLSGGASIASGGAPAVVKPLLQQAAKDTIVGTGSGVGEQAAEAGADWLGVKSPEYRNALKMAGGLTGGGLSGAVVGNRIKSLDNAIDKPDTSDFKIANVEPRFPSDVGQSSWIYNDFLPNRLGARGFSSQSAGKTQNEIADYAKRVLNPDPNEYTNPAGLGSDIGDLAQAAIRRMKGSNSTPPNPDLISEFEKLAYDQNPENIPDWMLQGKGGSRLDRLLGGGPTSQQTAAEAAAADSIGRRLILHAASDPSGNFDLAKLSKFWSTRPGDTQTALTRWQDGPGTLSDSLDRIQRLYDATADSRQLAKPVTGHSFPDAATSGGVGAYLGSHFGGEGADALSSLLGGGGGHGGLPSMFTGALVAMGAEPVLARGLAGMAQKGSFVERGTNLGQTMGNAAYQMMPDIYRPPANTGQPHAGISPPEGTQVHSWLSTVDRPTATAYVTQQLGSDVGQQLANTDPAGFKAALFSIASDPQLRAGLTPQESADNPAS